MIQARTQYNKLFLILYMKDPDYVTKIMASWMTLDELQVTKTRRDFIDRGGTKETKQFTHRHLFGIHFSYRHQLDDHKNWRHTPIYLDTTWETRFWPDCNLAWYISVSEVNTALASDNFQNYGVVPPSIDFWRALEIECLDNTIGVELGDNV